MNAVSRIPSHHKIRSLKWNEEEMEVGVRILTKGGHSQICKFERKGDEYSSKDVNSYQNLISNCERRGDRGSSKVVILG